MKQRDRFDRGKKWGDAQFDLPTKLLLSSEDIETMLNQMSLDDCVSIICEVLSRDDQVLEKVRNWINNP